MKAIIRKPHEKPEVIDIDNTLEALQKVVGGYIEAVGLGCSWVLLCDEEGKFKGYERNIKLDGDVVVGNVLFVQDGGDGEFTDLSEENIARIMGIPIKSSAEVIKCLKKSC